MLEKLMIFIVFLLPGKIFAAPCDINSQFAAGAKSVRVDTDCEATQTIVIPEGGELIGRGKITSSGSVTPMINASADRVRIAGISLNGQLTSLPIESTDSENLQLENVYITRGNFSGILCTNCKSATLRDVWITESYADGAKFRGKSDLLLIEGGGFNGNGLSTTINGNGIDLYPGGKRARIIGSQVLNNGSIIGGSGIVIKGGSNAELEQWVETDVQLIGLHVEGNKNHCLEIAQNGTSVPMPGRITVIGGVYSRCGIQGDANSSQGYDGIHAGGYAIQVNGAIVEGNGRYGINVPNYAGLVSVDGHVSGNGVAMNPATNSRGVYIDGKGIHVSVSASPGSGNGLLKSISELEQGIQTNPIRMGNNATQTNFESKPDLEQ